MLLVWRVTVIATVTRPSFEGGMISHKTDR